MDSAYLMLDYEKLLTPTLKLRNLISALSLFHINPVQSCVDELCFEHFMMCGFYKRSLPFNYIIKPI